MPTHGNAGVVLMPFGEKARREAEHVIVSLRRHNPDTPVVAVGDGEVAGASWIPWTGQSPFDDKAIRNYRFKAGRVKPHLCELSPFERTLYMDCDIQVLAPLAPAFALLETFDMLTTYHPDPFNRVPTQNVGALYNKPLAGWYHNRRERETTEREWGTGDVPYWNSGVVFWRRCEAVARVMAAWSEEWQRFGQWDEQLALMRATFRHPLKLAVLPVAWNAPHREQAQVIFHNYGRGTVRENVPQRNDGATPDAPPAWVTNTERETMARVAASVPEGGVVVEVGSLYGGTTATLAQAAPASARIFAVDDFSWSPIPEWPASEERLLDNMAALGIANVECLVGDSRQTGRRWRGHIDLLLVDGGHSYEFVAADLANFGPHADVVMCHDYGNPTWPSVKLAVDEWLKANPDRSIDEVADTVAVIRRR